MDIKTLYKYEREGGGITVSPTNPDAGIPYTEMYRIIADEGMLVTQDGTNKYPVIDTDTDVGWYEVEDDNPNNPEDGYEFGGGGAEVLMRQLTPSAEGR